eukprot:gene10288-9086_t
MLEQAEGLLSQGSEEQRRCSARTLLSLIHSESRPILMEPYSLEMLAMLVRAQALPDPDGTVAKLAKAAGTILAHHQYDATVANSVADSAISFLEQSGSENSMYACQKASSDTNCPMSRAVQDLKAGQHFWVAKRALLRFLLVFVFNNYFSLKSEVICRMAIGVAGLFMDTNADVCKKASTMLTLLIQ